MYIFLKRIEMDFNLKKAKFTEPLQKNNHRQKSALKNIL